MSQPNDIARPTEPKRPEASLGELFREMTAELGGLFRQEVELAKVETREEVQRSAKAAAAMTVAGVAAFLAVLFVSLALAWLLDQALNTALAFVIVGLLWAVGATVLLSIGRSRLRAVRPLPQTTASIKEDVAWAKDLTS
jgi:F0F1-type ATP synthase assembly protein I